MCEWANKAQVYKKENFVYYTTTPLEGFAPNISDSFC